MTTPLTETQRRAVVHVLKAVTRMPANAVGPFLQHTGHHFTPAESSRIRAAASMALLKLERRDD